MRVLVAERREGWPHHAWRRRWSLNPRRWAVAMTALIALCTACSHGSGSPRVAHIGATSATSSAGRTGGMAADIAHEAALLRFSACVRSHGVPDFPDPGLPAAGIRSGLAANAGRAEGMPARAPGRRAAPPSQPGLEDGRGDDESDHPLGVGV